MAFFVRQSLLSCLPFAAFFFASIANGQEAVLSGDEFNPNFTCQGSLYEPGPDDRRGDDWYDSVLTGRNIPITFKVTQYGEQKGMATLTVGDKAHDMTCQLKLVQSGKTSKSILSCVNGGTRENLIKVTAKPYGEGEKAYVSAFVSVGEKNPEHISLSCKWNSDIE